MKLAHNILIALLAAATISASAAGQTVRLRTTATVADRQVRLADVASIEGLSAEADRVVILTLGEGKTHASLNIAQIEAAMSAAGVNPARVDFCGAARCRVRIHTAAAPVRVVRPARQIQEPADRIPAPLDGLKSAPLAEPIGEQIVRQVAGKLSVGIDQIEVAFGRRYQDTAAMAPTGVVSIHSTDRKSLGRRLWRVEYSQAGRRYRRYIGGEVAISRKVVLAARRLDTGTTITAEDVHVSEYNDTGSESLLTDIASVVGQRVRRAIDADAPVTAERLVSPTLISRGQTAWVLCGAVRLPATAIEAGRRGDLIQFENPRSKKRFQARVVGAGQASLAMEVSK